MTEHWYAVDAFIWATAFLMFTMSVDSIAVAYSIIRGDFQ